MDSEWKDERFSHVSKDPRFRSMPKRERKVKIDRRFQAMFSDDRFKLKYSVDKKGRPTNKTSDEDLKRFYELSDDSDIQGSESGSDADSQDKDHKSITKGRTAAKQHKVKSQQEKNSSAKKRIIEKEICAKEQSKSPIPQTDVDINAKSNKLMKKKKVDKLSYESETILGKSTESLSVDKMGSEDLSNETDSEDSSDSGSRMNKSSKTGMTGQERDENNPDTLADEESDAGDGPDLARGEGNISSSDEEDDLDWGPDNEDGVEHEWGDMAKDVPEATVLGRRLAVCNMDWDRIKATDLFVLLSSFKPSGAIIHSVKIYPSEFGLQRMKEENAKGPMKFVGTDQEATNSAAEIEQDIEGSDYRMERLRRYQLDRLKYYYAVLECDSIETANHIYGECDGLEYETSTAVLDLRFIPDDMEFDQEPVSICEEMPDSYKPSTFVTAALSQSKVELTWDETDRDRIAVTRKKLSQDDINEMDFKAYLASSSEDEEDPYSGLVENDEEQSEEEGEEAQIQKYKSLVKDLEEAENQKDKRDVEMEITWEPGLRETTEQIVKKKGEKKELTIWEQYLEKKKEKKRIKREEKLKEKQDRHGTAEKSHKEDSEGGPAEDVGGQVFSDDELPEDVDLDDEYFKSQQISTNKSNEPRKKKRKKQKLQLTKTEEEELKQKQAELSLLMMDEEDNRQHFNLQQLTKTEKKNKKKKHAKDQTDMKITEDTFRFNTDDARFQAMYTSHHYNIDPSAPAFKRTKVMDNIIEEKLKRRKKMDKSIQENSRFDLKEPCLKTTLNVDPNDLPPITSAKMLEKATVKDKRGKDSNISSLVNSVKNKTKSYYKRNK